MDVLLSKMCPHRLEAKAVGMPEPQTRWLKQGVEIKQSQEYQIEEMEDGTSILIISEVYEDDAGEIVFEAHNALGAATTVAALSVDGQSSHHACSEALQCTTALLSNFLIFIWFDFSLFVCQARDFNMRHHRSSSLCFTLPYFSDHTISVVVRAHLPCVLHRSTCTLLHNIATLG